MTKVSIAIFSALTVALAPQALAQQSKKDNESRKEARKGDLRGDDLKYFRQMAQANLAEVEAGRMAENKASSDEVKKFARHMADEHGQALSDARSLAKNKGVEAPDEPARGGEERQGQGPEGGRPEVRAGDREAPRGGEKDRRLAQIAA